MARNLIKQRVGNNDQPVELSIPNSAGEHCGAETADFATKISAAMQVKPSSGAAKVPSVMSPVYSFYINLAPSHSLGGRDAAESPGLSAAHKKAQAQFRGIAAALLLRNVLGLKIETASFPLTAPAGLRNRFGRLVQTAPGFDRSPWNTDLHFLTLSSGGVKEPLALLSPYTLFCPAATRMQQCRSLFWYTEQGIWLDPTANDPAFATLNREVVRGVRKVIFKWLNHVLEPEVALDWPGLNLVEGSPRLITDQLRAWKDDIRKADPGIAADEKMAVVLSALEPKFVGGASPLLDECVQLASAAEEAAKAAKPDVDPSLLTDLPVHKGRLLVSKHLVSDGTRRLCGLQMGNPAFADCLDGLPLFGDQLTLTDGVRHFHVNYPYLNVEKAFVDTLYQIADHDVSAEFRVLRTENPPTSTAEYWLLPVVKEALSWLDIEGIGLETGRNETFPKCQRRLDGQNDNRVVSISIGGNPFPREYPQARRDGIFHPNLLDIRVWPKIVAPNIDSHYWRIRQLPNWDLHPSFLAWTNNQLTVVGWTDAWTEGIRFRFPMPSHINAGFYRVPLEVNATPVGLEFLHRGIILLKLLAPAAVAMTPTPCVLAVDFGTSNTCVIIAPAGPAGGKSPAPKQFEVQTASLHETPFYHGMPYKRENGFTEGAAPVFDFPIKYANELPLAEGHFFPTLFAAFTDGKLELQPPPGSQGEPQQLDMEFRLSYGRMYPRNVMFDSGYIRSLLRDSPMDSLPPGNDTRPVFLFDDIKHRNDRYRKAFLWDLAMLVKIATCQANQQVTEARFSYPRAFLEEKYAYFESEAMNIFERALGIPRAKISLITESHAVYRYTLTQDKTDHLVLDIGGGTTDFLATFPGAQAQSFQASYNLAARVLNDYFVTSRVFRHIFTGVVANAGLSRVAQASLNTIAPLVQGLDAVGGGNTSYGHQGFFGLLSLLGNQQYNNAFKGLCSAAGTGSYSNADVQKAVRGFLYSTLLLYGGLVYSAGLLMRERKVQSTALDIDLIGNGSKLYLLLQNIAIAPNAQQAVDGLFASLLAAAWGTTPTQVRVAFHADGKTFVSKGLAADSAVKAPPVGFLAASFDYLTGQKQRPAAATSQSELKQFIEEISVRLPGGDLIISGKHYPMVPFCSGLIKGELLGLLGGLQVAFQTAENDAAAQCTADYQNSMDPSKAAMATGCLESAQARESLFIIHLRTLLNHIRTEYGV